MRVAPENKGPLCADNHIMPGMAVVIPTMTAPAPIEISSAGSAQHSKVDRLVNIVKVGAMPDRQ